MQPCQDPWRNYKSNPNPNIDGLAYLWVKNQWWKCFNEYASSWFGRCTKAICVWQNSFGKRNLATVRLNKEPQDPIKGTYKRQSSSGNN